MKIRTRLLALLVSAVLTLGIVGGSFAEGGVLPPEGTAIVEKSAESTPEPTLTPTPTPEPTAEPTLTPEPTSVPTLDPPPASDPTPALETESPAPAGEGEGEATELPVEAPTETPTEAPTVGATVSVLAAGFADRAAVLLLGEQSLDLTGEYSYFLYDAPGTDEYTLTVGGTLAKEGYFFRDPGDSDPSLAEVLASSRNEPGAPLTLQAGLELNAKYVLALRLLEEGEERVIVTLSALTPEPSQEPEEEPEATLSQEDYYLSLLNLEAYTFTLNGKQKEYKAFGRESVGLYRSMKEGKQYVRNQAMVCVRSEEEARQVAAAYRATLLNYNGEGLALLELSDEIPTEILFTLSTREDVPLPALEPNRIKRLYAESVPQSVPSDPAYKKQWFHKNMGNELAWDYATGVGITVAVIDTGCQSSHSEFSNQISAKSARFNEAGTRTYTGAAVSDSDLEDGHGTHVSGIIAAKRNNGYGGCGVAPDAKLLICQMDGLGGDGLSEYALIQAINYVKGIAEVSIVNMSLGSHYSYGYSMSEKTAVAGLAASKLVVVAAGNENYGRAGFPAAYPEVLAVSATTSANKKASYSNYGPEVDIAAPGSGIYSTVPSYTFDTYDGTSMASPAVAGALAVIMDRYDCTPARARSYLLNSAKDLKNKSYYGAGLVQTGQAVTGRNVTVKSSSAKAGLALGGGFYEYGFIPTFTAVPNLGYTFVNWKKGSTIVSTSPEYTGYEVKTDGAVFTATFTALPKAAITASVCSYSSNLISWKALPNATSYRVLRSSSSKGIYTDVSGPIPFNASKAVYTYEDLGRTFGITSYYKVQAYFREQYTESGVKSVKTAWPTMKIAKAEQAGPFANRVTWNAVPNVTGYTLTRTIGKVVTLIEVPLTSLTATVDPKLGNLVTYEDKAAGITTNASSSYQVRARVGDPGPYATCSKPSAKKTVKAGWAKVAVTATSGAYDTGSWSYPITIAITPAPNAAGHELWWSRDKVNWNRVNMTGNTHVLTHLQTGAPVYVQVRPYAGTSAAHTAEGAWTALTARPVPAAPEKFWVGQEFVYDGYYPNYKFYVEHEGDWTPAPDANGYEVYRSNNLGKSFSKVMTLNDGDYIGFYYYIRFKTDAQYLAALGHLYKVRSYVTYKGAKYYGPFSPIVVSGDVNNTLSADWNGLTTLAADRFDRLEALMKEQQKGLSFDNAKELDGDTKNRPKTK